MRSVSHTVCVFGPMMSLAMYAIWSVMLSNVLHFLLKYIEFSSANLENALTIGCARAMIELITSKPLNDPDRMEYYAFMFFSYSLSLSQNQPSIVQHNTSTVYVVSRCAECLNANRIRSTLGKLRS